jgi:hypothetical protein
MVLPPQIGTGFGAETALLDTGDQDVESVKSDQQ